MKFIIVESHLEGYVVTNIMFLAIYRAFGFFGLLGYFGPRLYRLLILRIFWSKFQNLSQFSALVANPTNLKFFFVESCLEGYVVTIINFLAIFRTLGIFGFWAILGLDYTGY